MIGIVGSGIAVLTYVDKRRFARLVQALLEGFDRSAENIRNSTHNADVNLKKIHELALAVKDDPGGDNFNGTINGLLERTRNAARDAASATRMLDNFRNEANSVYNGVFTKRRPLRKELISSKIETDDEPGS